VLILNTSLSIHIAISNLYLCEEHVRKLIKCKTQAPLSTMRTPRPSIRLHNGHRDVSSPCVSATLKMKHKVRLCWQCLTGLVATATLSISCRIPSSLHSDREDIFTCQANFLVRPTKSKPVSIISQWPVGDEPSTPSQGDMAESHGADGTP